MLDNEKDRSLRLLELGIDQIVNWESRLVVYNTKFIDSSYTDDIRINGCSVRNAVSINQFCYVQDSISNQIYLAHIYQLSNGRKFASTEISFGVYGYWEIID